MIKTRMLQLAASLALSVALPSVASATAPLVRAFGPLQLGGSGESAIKQFGELGDKNISTDFELPPEVAPVGAIKYLLCDSADVVLLVGKISPMEAKILQITVEGKPCAKLAEFSIDGIGIGATEQQVLAKFGEPDRVIERPDSKSKTIAYTPSNVAFRIKDGILSAISIMYRNQMMVDDMVAKGGTATDAWLQIGDMRLRGSQYDLAREAFESVLKMQPKSATANLRLGSVYYIMAGSEKDTAPYLAKSEAAYRAVLAVEPNSDVATYNLGRVAIRNRKLAEARTLLTKAIALNPKNAAAYNELGILSENEKKLDDAEKNYRKAVELAPDKSQPHLNLARVRLAKGDRTGAIDEYSQAVVTELKSDSPNQRLIDDMRKTLAELRGQTVKPDSAPAKPAGQ
ncbi:MAG: tetratricopeptide repeat protein [Armatimonadota bacterium]